MCGRLVTSTLHGSVPGISSFSPGISRNPPCVSGRDAGFPRRVCAVMESGEFRVLSVPARRLKHMAIHTAIATMTTNHGDIRLNLFGDHAPKTVKNFVDLAEKDFYNGVIFHRIIRGFMIQGGDPDGTGMGGPGYTFDDEISPELTFSTKYLLAMANAGKRPDMTGRLRGTNGSQFFITTSTPSHLNGAHTIFGEVADDASKAVVDAIESVKTGPMDRPVEDVIIERITIEHV